MSIVLLLVFLFFGLPFSLIIGTLARILIYFDRNDSEELERWLEYGE